MQGLTLEFITFALHVQIQGQEEVRNKLYLPKLSEI